MSDIETVWVVLNENSNSITNIRSSQYMAEQECSRLNRENKWPNSYRVEKYMVDGGK
jgi:hypothetical protein